MNENDNDNNMNVNEGEPILRPEFSQNSMDPAAVQESYAGTGAQPPKKKRKTALIVVIAVVVALAALAGSVYCFAGDYVKNTFAMMTKDDTEYFKWLSKRAVDEQIEEMKLAYEKAQANKPETAEISGGRINFAVDMSKELTDLLELPELQRLGLSLAATVHESQVNIGLSAAYKGIEVLALNAMADVDAETLFAEIPTYKEGIIDLTELIKKSIEASGNSIKFNLDSLNLDSLNIESMKALEITGDRLAELYRKYAYYIIDSVNEASITKGESATIEDTEVEYSSVEVKLNADEIADMYKGLFEMIKEEELFTDLLAKSGMDSSSINSAYDEVIRGFKELSASNVEMKMSLFANNKGQLVGGGMAVKAEQTEIEIEAVGICEEERCDSDVVITVNNLTALTIEVRGEEEDDCYNGTVEIKPGKVITAALGGSDDIVVRINCEDIITEDTGIVSGTISLSAELSAAIEEMIGFPGLSDYEVIIGFESDDKQGVVNFDVKKSGADFASFEISAGEIEAEPFVTDGKQIYNFADTGLIDYIDINRLAAYILELHDKLQDETFDNLILGFAPLIVGGPTDFDGLKQIYDEGIFLKMDEMIKGLLAGGGETSDDWGDDEWSDDEWSDDEWSDDEWSDDEWSDDEWSDDEWSDDEWSDEDWGDVTEGPSADDLAAFPSYNGEPGIYYYPANYYAGFIESLYYDGIELLCFDGNPSDELLWNLFGDGYVFVEDRGAEFGDTVVFDATLMIGGMPISDYSLIDGMVYLGDYTYGEGVDDQIAGMMPGDSKDVNVVLGEEYGEFAGFEGVFQVTVKEIYENIPAEWNERYIVDYLGYESMDACLETLWDMVASGRLVSTDGLSESQLAGTVFNLAVGESSYYEPNAALYDYAYIDYYDAMSHEVSATGMTLEEYYASMGMTEEDLRNDINGAIEASFYRKAFVAAVAEMEGLYITEEEYKETIETYVDIFGVESVEELEEKISRIYLLEMIFEDKVMQLVYDRSYVIK